MAGVHGGGYLVSLEWRIETRPPRVRVKFRFGTEQAIAAPSAQIRSFFMIAPIRILEWRLCLRLTKDLELAGS